ncbi:MAG: benzoate-CoA ligase family protein [Pseudomonadota bacterium]
MPVGRGAEEQALADEIGFECPLRYNASRLLFDNIAAGRGDALAVLADSGSWTYGEMGTEADRIGAFLISRGLKADDRVLLFLDDEPIYPAAIMGAIKAGLVPILINTLSTPDLVRFYLEDSAARAAIISPGYKALFSPAALAGTPCGTLIIAGDTSDDRSAWGDLRATSPSLTEAPTTRDDMAFWMYSSGSTGRPKGVVHRHEDALYTHKSYAENILQLEPKDICFSVPKIFFAYGFGNSITFPFAVGAVSVLLAGRPDPVSIYDQIKRHRPTVLFGLPTLYTALTRSEAATTADLSSVRLCISAAEVLSAEIFNTWKERFGHEIIEGLGSTEMLHIYLSNDTQGRKLGSAGRRVPGYDIRLRDKDGADVGDGEEGVMEVRGLSGAKTYWNRPDKTEETMRDGWLWTGDRFERDADGYYFFKGRADDLVKVSGQWVWPLEIELALAEHPKIHECAVLAVELADKRMTLTAFVVPVAGTTPDDALADELKAYAKQVLLPHKYPRNVHFCDALPKTGTDKIDRQALKADALRAA